jgi:pyridoxine kinase
MKTVAAVHDLSCYAKSSLTVVIPSLAALGIESSILPTALLSTQTDGFDSYYYEDFTNQMREILKHWSTLELSFDGVYSGFLGSQKQVEIVAQLIDYNRQKNSDSLVVVDPVLGDGGVAYDPVGFSLIENMGHLVTKADLITPNITEAALLLNKDYSDTLSLDESAQWAYELSKMGPRYVAITSVMEKSNGNVVGYDSLKDQLTTTSHNYLPISYPGCGDLFASILTALMVKGESFDKALKKADELVSTAVYRSWKTKREQRRGVAVELIIDELVKESTIKNE